MSTPAYKKKAREEQHKREKLERERQALYASFSKPKARKEFIPLKTPEPYRRETPNYPSLSSSIPAGGTKRESPKYTGDYLVGIATMHKSNMVPVGRGDDPKAYATMRRN